MTPAEDIRAELLRRIEALYGDVVRAEEEYERVQEERDRLYRSLRRMADGMHTGDYGDAEAALAEATALLRELDAPGEG